MSEMTLSTAIRLGAMLKPQKYGSPKDARLSTVRATCALAAAGEAIGMEYLDVTAPTFMSRWGHWLITFVSCPACGYDREVVSIVAHLNDRHRWSRERIAGWVESLERANDPQAEPTSVAVQS